MVTTGALTMLERPVKPIAWLRFVACAAISLTLVSLVDNGAWKLAHRVAPGLAFIGHYRLSSLAVCIKLVLALVGRRAFRLPRADTNWRKVGVVAGLWILGTALSVVVMKVWTPTVGFRDAGDWVAFLGTGLLAEELLFRGLLFDLASGVLEDPPAARVGPVVLVTSALFALSHVQYHGFRIDSATMTQVLYTFPAGVAFAYVRRQTGSLWPSVALHLVCNLFSVVPVLTR